MVNGKWSNGVGLRGPSIYHSPFTIHRKRENGKQSDHVGLHGPSIYHSPFTIYRFLDVIEDSFVVVRAIFCPRR
jgi:hypothetical protein